MPVRNEAGNVAPLIAEIRAAMAAMGAAYEIIYVDDGSTDDDGSNLGTRSG